MSSPGPAALTASQDSTGRHPRHYLLTVRPECALHAWHAQLVAEDGGRLDFQTPIELLRHLAQLGRSDLPPGSLK
jgi:hypothetical protein